MSLIFVLAIFCTYPKAILPGTVVSGAEPRKTPSGKLVRRRVR